MRAILMRRHFSKVYDEVSKMAINGVTSKQRVDQWHDTMFNPGDV